MCLVQFKWLLYIFSSPALLRKSCATFFSLSSFSILGSQTCTLLPPLSNLVFAEGLRIFLRGCNLIWGPRIIWVFTASYMHWRSGAYIASGNVRILVHCKPHFRRQKQAMKCTFRIVARHGLLPWDMAPIIERDGTRLIDSLWGSFVINKNSFMQHISLFFCSHQ